MKEVGIYEAKTHLPRLITEVEQGQSVTITRHGKAVARLVPVSSKKRNIDEVIADIREFRKGNRLDGLKIRDLIEEGRRH